jgi:hypothetical protein
LNQWCGGLPDNGLFAADSNHPNVQMAFNDTSVAPNSALLGGSYPSSVTFPIGPTSFSSLQLYLTSTEGASNTEVWLQYTDCTTDSINVTVPDWYNGLANAPLYLVQGNLSRFSSAGSDGSYSYWLYGVNVAVNPAKILKSVSVANYSSGSRLVLYGATAYDAGASSASDAGPDAEAGQPVGFSNPVQITGIPFNADIVETTATGGAPLTAMDGAGNGNVFPTASVVTAAGMGFPASLGLPDNAQFAGDGTNIPPVQLAWNNSANVLNSILVSDTLGTTFQCSIPPGPYTNLQIYATGGNGPSMISYTLTYSDGSTSVASAHVPDWCTSTPPPGTYPLIKVFRYSTLTSKVDPSVQCGIWAIDLSPDPSKMLTQISFVDQIDPTNPNPNANLIFFGATAW